MSNETFISVQCLAQRLGLPVAWLKAEAEAGRIPSLPAGRRLVFKPEVVEQAVMERADDQGKGAGQ